MNIAYKREKIQKKKEKSALNNLGVADYKVNGNIRIICLANKWVGRE